MFRTYTYGSQVTSIFCSQCLELRHTGFKLCLELKHMCSLENEGKGANNNFRRFYRMDETDARAAILDLSEFSEASHRFFDINYSLKDKYSRIIESFIPCGPNLRQDEVGSLLLPKSFADQGFEA